MTHGRARAWIPLSAGGDLSPEKQRRLDRHLASCADCREEYRAYRESLDLARSAARRERTPDWSAAEWRRVMRSVLSQESEGRLAGTPRFRGWAWAAAGALVIVLIIGGAFFLKRTSVRPIIVQRGRFADVVLPEKKPPVSPLLSVQSHEKNRRPQTGTQSLLAQKTPPPAPRPTSQPATPSPAQTVMAMTFISQETGLTIHWVFNESFDYKEDKK